MTLSMCELRATVSLVPSSTIVLPNLNKTALKTGKLLEAIDGFESSPQYAALAIIIFGSSIRIPAFEKRTTRHFFGLFKRTQTVCTTKTANDIDVMVVRATGAEVKGFKLPLSYQVECTDGYGSWIENRVVDNGLDINFTTADAAQRAFGEGASTAVAIQTEGIVLAGDPGFRVQPWRYFHREGANFVIREVERPAEPTTPYRG